MAQVSVPRLNRIEPSQALPKNDRINMNVQDQGARILQQGGMLANIAETADKVYIAAEDNKIEQLSNEAEIEYSSWNAQELQKLKSYQGDPTDAYVEYDTKVQEKRKEILERRPDLGERVRNNMTARLDKAIGTQTIAAYNQRGAQQETYENNIFESTVKLKKDNLPVSAGYIQKDDPSSFLMFDQGMSDIRTTIAKRGLKNGTVELLPDDAQTWSHSYVNEDGKVVKVLETPLAKQRIAKEQSEGVKSSIEVLIAGGRVEEAKMMQEKYKGYIDPASAAKIDNKFKTAGRKDEAYNIVGSMQGKSEDAQLAAIEKIADPELRSEVLKIKDADTRRLEALKERKGKANYDTLANRVLAKMNSNQPYFGIADLENDPLYKQTWDSIPPAKKKAIIEMVDAPKESNSKSEIRVQSLFLGTDQEHQLETMTPEDFAEYTSGLSKADKKKYTGMYMSLRTQSEGERRSMYKQAGKMLQDQFLIDGHIKRNSYGKIAGDDEVTLLKAQNSLIDHLSTQYGSFNEKQLQDFVKEFSAAEIKEKAFNPASRIPVKSKSSVKTATSDVTLPADKDVILSLKRDYREKYNKWPAPNDEKWMALLKSKGY